MRKFLLAFAAVMAVVFGTVGVADAYPPNGANVVVNPASPSSGAPVRITANCVVGETVTFTLGGQSTTAVCVAIDPSNPLLGGTATATINAPTAAGTYTGTVTGSVSGVLGSFAVTVSAATATTVAPTGALPATGSDGTSTMTMIAGGLLVVGLGLFGVATARRRQDATAA